MPIFINFSLFRLFSILAIIFVCFFSCSDSIEQETEVSENLKLTNQFGFYSDSLKVDSTIVNRNETLTDVLLPFGVPYQKIVEIASVDSELFDEKKIKSGNEFFVYSTDDSLATIEYIVFKPDLLNYTVIDLTDSLNIITGQKSITRIEKTIAGVIQNSLFQSISASGGNDALALKMVDVFAWQIDFYTIQKGDSYKIVYEQAYVDSQFYGTGRVKASIFNHKEKDFYGFYFDQGDGIDYFDEKGGSLRKAFLKAPLKFSRISSRYQKSRLHPVLKVRRPHLGVDYAAPTGTPVKAIGDGVVLDARRKGGNGNYVKIKHNATYSSAYLHLSKYGKGIKAGVRVKQGQIIGYVGSTGLSSGPHLDLRFYKNGQPINYLNVEFPPSKPVKKQNLTKYDSVKNHYWQIMDKIEIFNTKTEDIAIK